MRNALVFGGANSLDFIDVRLGVIRIPEVSLKLQEAQQIWDRHRDDSFCFHTYLMSDDETFFNNVGLKTLCLSIVQLGLVERYRRLFRAPDCYIGNVQRDSALLVLCGRQSLAQLIMTSTAMGMPEAADDGVMQLNGQALPRYQTFERVIVGDDENEHFMAVHEPELKLATAIEHAIDEKGVTKIVHVGPGQLERSVSLALEPREISIVESIDVDPMLGWFWRDMRYGTLGRSEHNAI